MKWVHRSSDAFSRQSRSDGLNGRTANPAGHVAARQRHSITGPAGQDDSSHRFHRNQDSEGLNMLVLSRHRDESIVIGDDIVVTIVDIRGDKVRLGIQAPTHVSVHRQEIYDAIQREKSGDSPASKSAPK
jgi:carbon storage regulator